MQYKSRKLLSRVSGLFQGIGFCVRQIHKHKIYFLQKHNVLEKKTFTRPLKTMFILIYEWLTIGVIVIH